LSEDSTEIVRFLFVLFRNVEVKKEWKLWPGPTVDSLFFEAVYICEAEKQVKVML